MAGRATPADTTAVPAELFADGFESGNTSAWTRTVPKSQHHAGFTAVRASALMYSLYFLNVRRIPPQSLVLNHSAWLQ